MISDGAASEPVTSDGVPEAHWVGEDVADASELFRLQALERCLDDRSQRLLSDHVGVSAGWRCLELGAGAGSMVRWLADRVGSSGSVVALDMNCRFLDDLPENVEVVQLELGREELELGEFDLIHHRTVLTYVPGPDEVLAQLAGMLRPGGWLLGEEPIFGGPDEVIAGDTDDKLLARCFEIIDDAMGRAGVERRIGARFPRLLGEVGLVERGHEATVGISQGGDHGWSDTVWPMIEAFGSQFEEIGGLTGSDLQRIVEMLREDPNVWFMGPIVVAGWGRRST